jgi:hypothetical protein
MRRSTLKTGSAASYYRPASPLPPAQDLRRFACACRDLANQESDTARRGLFRQMEAAWTALAAQVERTDSLIVKLQAIQRESLN